MASILARKRVNWGIMKNWLKGGDKQYIILECPHCFIVCVT